MWHTIQNGYTEASLLIKHCALQLYLESLCFRAIGRLLNFSYVSTYNWIKLFGERLKTLKSENKIKNIEIDEIHTYVSNKKTIDGYGLLLIELRKKTSTSLLVKEI